MEDYKTIIQNAYTFLYPLVLMDATCMTSTNTIKTNDKKAPINQLLHTRKLMTAQDKAVVTPNVDTIYTQAWLDLSTGPWVLTVPSTDRFFNVQILDAWTDVPFVITEAGSYAFVKENEKVDIPVGVKRIDVDTDLVWLITRILIKGQDDIDNVRDIQNKMELVPLDYYVSNKLYTAPDGTYDSNKEIVPVEYVRNMTPSEFFNKANKLLINNPIRKEDEEYCKSFVELGIGAGLTFNSESCKFDIGKIWKEVINDFAANVLKQASKFSQKIGIWEMLGGPIAEFKTEYGYRACVALVGLGANPMYVAVYPKCEIDSDGEELNGKNTYMIHFNSLPKVMDKGFWSITAYGNDDFLIPNEKDIYNVNDRSNYTLNDDGTLDVVLSVSDLNDGHFWIPVCNDKFHLFLRIYLPDVEALKNWEAPSIHKI